MIFSVLLWRFYIAKPSVFVANFEHVFVTLVMTKYEKQLLFSTVMPIFACND